MKFPKIRPVKRKVLAAAPTVSTISAVGPGEFHELDLKQWTCTFRCPRCLESVLLSTDYSLKGGVSLPNPFRCPYCGFTSDLYAGEFRQRPDWKGRPDHLDELIEANRGHLQRVRPDVDLPDVAEAKARWES